MKLEGDESVIDALKEKKRLIESGESHEHIQLLLFVDGGLMKGAYSVGAGLALEESGYTDVFDHMVGVSSGAPELAYFLSKQVRTCGSVIYEECCTREFFNPFRWSNMLSSKYIRSVLEGATGKRLDFSRILARKDSLYIAMTDYESAQPILFQPQNKEELLESIRASISMPGMSGQPVTIQGRRYVDGAAAVPHALTPALEQMPAVTHVLVLTNQDKDTRAVPFLENVFNNTFFRHRMSATLRKASANRRQTRHAYINTLLSNHSKPVLFVWGDGSIGSFERNRKKVQEVVEHSRDWWRELLR